MEHGFDALAKAVAEPGSRRELLKRVGAAALGMVLASVGVACEPRTTTGPRLLQPLFDARGRCKKVGQNCRQNSECCSDFCDPYTGMCACPTGTVVCSLSGQCVPGCDPPFVFDPATCHCLCPPNTVTCGGVTCCAPGTTCCGTSCVDLSIDLQNCGSCGTTCTAPNATTACVNGTCRMVACTPGFGDCNGNPSDGCETNVLTDPRNCGSCGHTCTGPHATTACVNGICQTVACDPGFGDCNGNPSDGCETNLLLDPDNCGSCRSVCSGNHVAVRSCVGGRCQPICEPGFGDCNGNPNDGCETSLNNNINCGRCGLVCPPGTSCVSGVCV